ncbi:MAG TPA: hypothetical protein VGR14_20530 [Verrucomicrobiae bacterium]|jgi:hypothetical protein|nr:hypothetical protein [Verrucomicrobiae bacterium]
MNHYWSVFLTLLATPFEHLGLIWGIVPIYFGLLLNETTSTKANFRTSIQTGFSFVWAGAHWLYPYFAAAGAGGYLLQRNAMLPVNVLVTFLVLALGVAALVSGFRKRFPAYGSFLGQTRFANYFMITIYPMQANALVWTWERLAAVVIFAVPAWLALHYGLMPFRSGK